MSVPDASHKAWMDLVTGRLTPPLKFLAGKIVLGRLMTEVQADPSPEKLRKCIEQLHDLYAKNVHIPSAQADVQTIFS